MILDYITLHMAGETRVDAMDVSRHVRDYYGVRVDWHTAADVLEELSQDGQIIRNGCTFDRMSGYDIL